MPVIGIGVDALRRRLGREVAEDELLRLLEQIGCDVEGFASLKRTRCARCGWIEERTETEDPPARCDRCDTDHRADPSSLEEIGDLPVVRMELLAVRPDMFDPGGLGRALRGILGIEVGAARYEIRPPAARLVVDRSVRDPRSARPFIACAVLEEARLDAESVKTLMKLQENLHWALGRNRKHASIGVYDMDTFEADLEYTTEDPDRYRFVPLGARGTAREHERTLRAILDEHPKGRAFRHLLERHERYPILRDARGRVLSMPPIINSEETKVHPGSRRLLIDVTGLGERVVHRTLNILVTSLLELLPGGRLAAVTIAGASDPSGASARKGTITTPDLTPQKALVHCSEAARLLGIPLETDQAVELLRRMRHDARALDRERIEVAVPAYRNDILHECDLAEDLAIAYGYEKITPALLPARNVGQALLQEERAATAREILCGLGFHEVLTLILTSDEDHDFALGLPVDPRAVRIANPISSEQTRVRTRLLPGLLQVFRHNLHQPLPQRIFEVGDATWFDPSSETLATEHRMLALGIVAPKTGFTDVRALVEAIAREFGAALAWEPAEEAPFLAGRCARVRTGEDEIGVLGEVDPEVLDRFGLENPAVLAELSLDRLAGTEPRRRFVLDDIDRKGR